MDRRSFNRIAGIALTAVVADLEAKEPIGLATRCRALEAEIGGRLGVSCLVPGRGEPVGYRHRERFPMCSTFKWLAAASLLARVDDGRERLDRRIRVDAADLMAWAPVTKHHLGGDGMTLGALCDAAFHRERQHRGQPDPARRRRAGRMEPLREVDRRYADPPRPRGADAERRPARRRP